MQHLRTVRAVDIHPMIMQSYIELVKMGSLDSVEWNGGMEWWNGLLEWNSGMPHPLPRLSIPCLSYLDRSRIFYQPKFLAYSACTGKHSIQYNHASP